MEEGKKRRLGAGRVAFLARKDAIAAKVEAGHTLITVYEEYQKELGIGYVQFLNYVAKYVKGKSPENKATEPIETATKEKELSTSEYLRTRPNKKEIL